DDQHLLSRLNPSDLQALDGGKPGDRDHRGLLEADSGRLVDELVLPCRRVLGEGASGYPEDLVARPEPGHADPTATTVPATVQAWDALLGMAEPMIRIRYGWPARRCPVPRSTPAARTSTKTSFAATAGLSTSSNRSTSGDP